MAEQTISWQISDLELQSEGPVVFSTFSCGGGSSMGYKLAGCNVIGANDIDPMMEKHYRKNLSPPVYYLSPVADLLKIDLDKRLFELDILDGSPPCSSFSMAGNREQDWGKSKIFREGQALQVLDRLFFDYLDLVGLLRPKISIAENVSGMLKGSAKNYVREILARYKKLGYRAQLFLINAANCGVPQNRERVFFCAVRDDISSKKLVLNPRKRIITASEAFEGLELSEKELAAFAWRKTDKEFWAYTAPGKHYSTACIVKRGKGSFFNHFKLHPNKPSHTLTANGNHHTHWKEPRRITFRELKRLGSFPDDYWAETDSLGAYMVGMSVPPKMAEQVAEAVVNQWL